MTEKNENPTETKTEPIDLSTISDADIKAMKVDDLKELCEDQQLPKGGVKKDMVKRILLAKHGRSDKYVGANTICKVCPAKVVVTGTKSEPTTDGKTLITRQMKCRGKNTHRYPLKEII